ncbi:MAG: MBOAT family protein, partial [Oscillospiraceae bacterium]|nr:MBOAT family protein [Oscillospiraceae bacterium]
MVFSSLEFLFLYLPITLLLYYLIPHRHRKWRNLVLLVMSLIFYGWGEPVYVFLMMFTITVDYVCVYFVDKYRDTDQGKSKTFLILSICINLATLGFFKYYDFIVTNLHHIPGLGGLPLLGLSLPLGISFYTFHALSYVIDVYKRDAKIQKNVITFGTYVTMFPSLIAGPIIRYRDVDEQLRERKESVALFASGVRTFLAGMAKKVFLANIAGQMWANFRDLPVDQRSVIGCWIGMLCYAFQIY